MKKIINTIGSLWNAMKFNAMGVMLILFVSSIAVLIVALEDNNPRPSAEIEDAVWTEWQEMEPGARYIVCGMFERLGNSDEFFQMLMTEGGVSEMEAKAKIAVMEQECDRV